tara:strand:+ start:342 stop:1514 length:1173 start_codon:yes stop_codon:yes gene_type:complete
MTIKSSGSSLSFSEIESEFGSNPGRSLGQYRSTDSNFQNKNLGALSNLPLDTGIPVSGQIKFSDFYSKKLNLVVDYFDDTGSSGGQANNVLNREDDGANTMAATWRYNNQSSRVRVVGGYRSRPTGTLSGTYNLSSTAWGGGKKVFIHVNKSVGGQKASGDAGTKNRVALRTGGWPSGTSLQIDIGSSGRIQGAGGNGRQGATSSGTPSPAFTGTSGLGIEYPAQINNSGIIRCGYGGGGGGAGSWSDPNKNPRDFGRSGGGGGGGAGIPVGFGGPQNTGGYGTVGGNSPSSQAGKGKAGTDATFDNNGTGGDGGDHGEGGGEAGDGGNGGDRNDSAQSGDAGSPNRGAGGSPGSNGHGIIFSSSSVQNNSSGNKTLSSSDGGVIVGGVA